MKHRQIALSLCVGVGLMFATVAVAAEWTRTAAPALATFDASGPGGFRFQGTTAEVNVVQTDTTLSVVVPLKNVKSGLPSRDTHMREKYLEVDKYPDATLQVARGALKVPKVGEKLSAQAKGVFLLHGKQHDVTFKYSGTCAANNVCEVSGTTQIDLNDYSIKIPNYLGITVKPEIDVATTFQVTHDIAGVAATAPVVPAAPAAVVAPAPAVP